jgi:plastocyanin domain-containing protein
MLNRYKMFSILIVLGLLLSVSVNVTAQMTFNGSGHISAQSSFSHIEQPLSLKLGVTVGGLALIGLELWWFLLSKPKSQRAGAQKDVQELDIRMNGREEPPASLKKP